MDRLTYRDKTVPHTNAKGELWEAYSDRNYNEVINKLAAYEDTGLSPEQIQYILPKQSAEEAVKRMIEERKRYDEWFAWKEAEEQGLLVRLPCKVGDTVWFYLYEDRYYLREGIYRGTITELKSVQRLNQSPLVLAVVEYEYPDPWYGGKMKRSEMHCSFGAYGTWVQFYLTREEAEAALKNN